MMKKIIPVAVLMLMLGVAPSGYAQVTSGAYSLSPFYGGYSFEGNEDLETHPAMGFRAGYSFTPNWGLEGYLHAVKTKTDAFPGNPDVDLFGYGLEALYHFMPEGRLVPFLAAGIGGARYDGSGGAGDRNKFTADYGFGLKYFLRDDLALRADVRHVIPFNDRYNNLLYTIGLAFSWGGEKKMVAATKAPEPPAEVVLDSDKDGVPDRADKCPGTPAGVAVDRDGCPSDFDGDGVYDYLDDCPSTPPGVQVDKVGCPLDSDHDGVYDFVDECPNTPPGVKVDNVGCPLDSDKDGVYDYLDKCPGTPAGVKVDDKGCPLPEVKKETPAPAPPPPPPEKKETPAPRAEKVEKAIVQKGRVTLNVEFDFDKSVVKKKYDDEIGFLAAVLKKYPELKITIEGHTDNIGEFEYNQGLSERRANAVKKYLVDKFGVDASRLTAVGYGETRPVRSNATREGRQENRRVEAAADYIIKD